MQIRIERNKISTIIVMYSVFVLGKFFKKYFLSIIILRDENKRIYVSVWNWIQRFSSYQINNRKRVSAFIIDETVILQVGTQYFDGENDLTKITGN